MEILQVIIGMTCFMGIIVLYAHFSEKLSENSRNLLNSTIIMIMMIVVVAIVATTQDDENLSKKPCANQDMACTERE